MVVGAKALRQGWVCCDLETTQRPVRLSRVKGRREADGADHTGSLHVCEDRGVTLSAMGAHWRALRRARHGPTFVLKASLAQTAVKDGWSEGKADAESSGKRVTQWLVVWLRPSCRRLSGWEGADFHLHGKKIHWDFLMAKWWKRNDDCRLTSSTFSLDTWSDGVDIQ